MKRMRYERQLSEGRHARPGERCPYGIAELGKRCAWLAGYHDRHGQPAPTDPA